MFKRLIWSAGALILLSLAILLRPLAVSEINIRKGTDQYPFGPVSPRHVVRQTFKATADRMSGVGVVFDKAHLPSGGRAFVSVVDVEEKELPKPPSAWRERPLVTVEANFDGLQRNAVEVLRFSPIKVKVGKSYVLKVAVESDGQKNGVFIWSTKKDRYREGSLYVNDDRAAGDMLFYIYRTFSPFDFAMKVGGGALQPLLPGYVLMILLALSVALSGLLVGELWHHNFSLRPSGRTASSGSTSCSPRCFCE